MAARRSYDRRSFLARVAGLSALGLAGCATPRREERAYDPLEDAAPRERGPVRPGGQAPEPECTDADSGTRSDPPGNGRRCSAGRHRTRGRRH